MTRKCDDEKIDARIRLSESMLGSEERTVSLKEDLISSKFFIESETAWMLASRISLCEEIDGEQDRDSAIARNSFESKTISDML